MRDRPEKKVARTGRLLAIRTFLPVISAVRYRQNSPVARIVTGDITNLWHSCGSLFSCEAGGDLRQERLAAGVAVEVVGRERRPFE